MGKTLELEAARCLVTSHNFFLNSTSPYVALEVILSYFLHKAAVSLTEAVVMIWKLLGPGVMCHISVLASGLCFG